MTTDYKIKSQEEMVKKLHNEFQKATKEVDTLFISVKNMEDPELVLKMKALNTIRNVLVQEEKKLVAMKNEKTT